MQEKKETKKANCIRMCYISHGDSRFVLIFFADLFAVLIEPQEQVSNLLSLLSRSVGDGGE